MMKRCCCGYQGQHQSHKSVHDVFAEIGLKNLSGSFKYLSETQRYTN